jgi:hypothetical protein
LDSSELVDFGQRQEIEMRKRDYSAYGSDKRLKTTTRVKHGCCYRLKSGRRAGQLCGAAIESMIAPTDYCPIHSAKVVSYANQSAE